MRRAGLEETRGFLHSFDRPRLYAFGPPALDNVRAHAAYWPLLSALADRNATDRHRRGRGNRREEATYMKDRLGSAADSPRLGRRCRPGVRPSPAAEHEAYKPEQTPDGKPNLNGIWQTLGTAYWNIEGHAAQSGPIVALGAVGAIPAGLGVVEGGEIPYQSVGRGETENRTAKNGWKLDPVVKCYMPGIPRANYMPFPFQIVQTPGAHLDCLRIRKRHARHLHEQAGFREPRRYLDGPLAWALGRGHVGCRRDEFRRTDVVRPGRKFPQRPAPRRRALYPYRSEHDHVPSRNRRSQGVHTPLER